MLMVLSNDLAGYYPKGASESYIENEPGPTFPARKPLWMHNEVSKPLQNSSAVPILSYCPTIPLIILFSLLTFTDGRPSVVETAKQALQ